MDSTKGSQSVRIDFENPFEDDNYYVECTCQSVNVNKSSLKWIDWTVGGKSNSHVTIMFWNEQSVALSETVWAVTVKPYSL